VKKEAAEFPDRERAFGLMAAVDVLRQKGRWRLTGREALSAGRRPQRHRPNNSKHPINSNPLRIRKRPKSDGWQTLATNPVDQQFDLSA
jgi:hypothetical protein